jgi:hypothetical protein
MRILTVAVVIAAAGLAGMGSTEGLKLSDGEGLPKGMSLPDGVSLIDKVTKVGFAGFVIDPHTQTVVVDGEVAGKGWSDPLLHWLDEVQIPEHTDKYLDIAFVAVPPKPMTTSSATETISADKIFDRRNSSDEGVRVWSQKNCIEMSWAGVAKEMELKDCRAAATATQP